MHMQGAQLFLGVDDLALRTYTPTSWSGDTGTTRILAYLHGDTPGASEVARSIRESLETDGITVAAIGGDSG